MGDRICRLEEALQQSTRSRDTCPIIREDSIRTDPPIDVQGAPNGKPEPLKDAEANYGSQYSDSPSTMNVEAATTIFDHSLASEVSDECFYVDKCTYRLWHNLGVIHSKLI
jgi:hypothetical protein